MPSIAVELVIVVLLIILNGVFAMAELSIVSARKARLEQLANAGDRRARAALELANEPNQLLSTVQVGITLVGIFTGAFGGATLAGELAAQIRQVPALAPYGEPLGLAIKELLEVRKLPSEESGDYHTVGGLMMLQLGRIPSDGDHFE